MPLDRRRMKLHGVLETCLYAADLGGVRPFYREVLGFELIAEEEGRHLFFRCGEAMLLVFNPEKTASGSTLVGEVPVPAHGAHGPGHAAFRVEEAELGAWRERLKECGVAIESEIAWPKGGWSIYFRDPAGNSLELATPAVWGLA